MDTMKFAAGLTVTGVVGWLLLEALKMLMVPVTAWVIAMLTIALKVVLVIVGLGVALGVGIFFLKRSQTESSA